MKKVNVQMTEEQYARFHFEEFLRINNRSTLREDDGTYANRDTQNMWMAYRVGFRAAVSLFGESTDF